LQTVAVSEPLRSTVVAVVEATVNVPVWSLSGTHSVLVRPNPAFTSSSPAAAGDVANRTGVTAGSVILAASLTSTRSRSAWGTSRMAGRTLPPSWVRSVRPTVTVVATAGLPSAGLPSAAKQVAAVRTHCGAMRVPVQALCSPTLILAT
jgi:hypothetical protein